MSITTDLGTPTQSNNISRKEVLKAYKWREGLIPLSLSNHALRRIEERVDGEFPIIPTVVRITRNNICSGRSKDGKKLTSVKLRLDYKRDKWMYLVICPNSGVVKTLYINYKDAKKEAVSRKKQGIKEKEACCEEAYNGGDGTEQSGEPENEGLLSGNMGREKISKWKQLLGNIRRLARVRMLDFILPPCTP